HADVTAWRVAGVDAARGEAGKLQQGEFRQLEGVGDGVPDRRDAVVINRVNNKFDGCRRDLLQPVPERLDQRDALLEAVRQGLGDELPERLHRRLNDLLPGELDNL